MFTIEWGGWQVLGPTFDNRTFRTNKMDFGLFFPEYDIPEYLCSFRSWCWLVGLGPRIKYHVRSGPKKMYSGINCGMYGHFGVTFQSAKIGYLWSLFPNNVV